MHVKRICSSSINESKKERLHKLQSVVEKPFSHMTYTEAIDVLTSCNEKFEYPISWGTDLQAEHERYLTEKHVDGPLILTDYPSCQSNLSTCGSVTMVRLLLRWMCLVPGVGEIIGGSQREERLDVLQRRMAEADLDQSEYEWYIDLRRFGTVPHAGFGLGLERVVQYVSGMGNIRDVIPFPRTPGNADF